MSISPMTISPNPNKPYKYSLHRRSNSDELDVFDAARYFSSINEEDKRNHINSSKNTTQRLDTIIESDRRVVHKPGRLSLDMPPKIRLSSNLAIISPQEFCAIDRQKKECSKDHNKKYKQPSSPGAKLASFLNSLFNHTTRNKKKNKKSKNQDFEEDHQNQNPCAGPRRKRSSSISHFGIIRKESVNDYNDLNTSKLSMKLFSSSGSGLKAPPDPVYADTPAKCSKEYMELSDYHYHKHVISLPKCGQHGIDSKRASDNRFCDHEKTDSKTGNLGFSDRDLSESNWGTTDHDGADSDSSSDLFDLPNIHESVFYSSSGLPVYESTHVDRIKNISAAAPISTATKL